MMEALEMWGDLHVERAFNGQEGVDKYMAARPDLVIMDISMPVMDGYESSRKIKSFDPRAKILVLTGNTQDVRARKTLEEGTALSLLQKPLRLKDLLKVVKQSLSQA